MRLNKAEFIRNIDLSLRAWHADEYLKGSVQRQFVSCKMAMRCLNRNAKILSVGAGGAFVEEVLARKLGARIYVVDFEGAVKKLEDLYDSIFECAFGEDVTQESWSPPVENLDAVFWFDNIEHLSTDPGLILRKLKSALSPGGQIFITTDNFARIRNVLKLISGRSIVARPNELFSTTEYVNEHIHRREYTALELGEMLSLAGFRVAETKYLWQTDREAFPKMAIRIFEQLFPPFRPHILIRAIA